MTKPISQDSPEPSLREAVFESAMRLREARGKLKTAEARCERIEALVSLAQKAGKAKDEELQRAHLADAQKISDNLQDAKWEFEGARRALLQSLRVAAVQDDAVGRLLEQIEKLSPYPSVRVAGEILALIDTLPRNETQSPQKRTVPSWSKLHLLPDAHPSVEDRKLLAELLVETIDVGRYTLRYVQDEMGLAEGTLKRVRRGERIQPESWRRAVQFVRKRHPDASR